MSAIKDGRVPITLDRERHMLFSLNVLDEMQDEFGGYDKLTEALTGPEAISNLKWLLTEVLNEGAAEGEDPLTEEQVGRMVHVGNLQDVRNALFRAFSVGTTGAETHREGNDTPDDEDEEESEKN